MKFKINNYKKILSHNLNHKLFRYMNLAEVIKTEQSLSMDEIRVYQTYQKYSQLIPTMKPLDK